MIAATEECKVRIGIKEDVMGSWFPAGFRLQLVPCSFGFS
jgi:hypothetical protein